MLKISDLKVTVDGKAILNGLNLEVGPGEVHAIMGAKRFGQEHARQCHRRSRGL